MLVIISPHLAVPVAEVMRYAAAVRLAGMVRNTSQAARVVLFAALMLVTVLAAAMVRAAHQMATMVIELMRFAAAMMLYMFCAVIAVMVVMNLIMAR